MGCLHDCARDHTDSFDALEELSDSLFAEADALMAEKSAQCATRCASVDDDTTGSQQQGAASMSLFLCLTEKRNGFSHQHCHVFLSSSSQNCALTRATRAHNWCDRRKKE